jgi:hypothetical protein
MCDDATIELQALQATYEAALAVTSTAPVAVTVALAPRGWPLVATDRSAEAAANDVEAPAEHEAQCFVRASLILECGPEYPAQQPAIRLLKPKGARLSCAAFTPQHLVDGLLLRTTDAF